MGRKGGFSAAEQGNLVQSSLQEVQMSQIPTNYFFLRIALCGIVRTPGPGVQCLLYRVWLSRRMMATVDKTSVAICVSHQVDCLVPTLQRLLLVIRRSWLQPCSVAGLEMQVLPTSPAEPRGEEPLLFSDFSTDLHSYCRLPYYAFLPKPSGSQFRKSHRHLRLFTTSSVAYFSSMALQSATDGKTKSRGESVYVLTVWEWTGGENKFFPA